MDHKQEAINTSAIFTIFQDNETICTLKQPIPPSIWFIILLILFMNQIYPINELIDNIKHYKVEHGNDNHLLSQLQQELISNTLKTHLKHVIIRINKQTVSISDKDEYESNS